MRPWSVAAGALKLAIYAEKLDYYGKFDMFSFFIVGVCDIRQAHTRIVIYVGKLSRILVTIQ